MKIGQLVHFKAVNKKGKITKKTGVIVKITRAYVSIKSGYKIFDVTHSEVETNED